MIVIIITKMIMINDSTKDENDMTHNGDSADAAALPSQVPLGQGAARQPTEPWNSGPAPGGLRLCQGLAGPSDLGRKLPGDGVMAGTPGISMTGVPR